MGSFIYHPQFIDGAMIAAGVIEDNNNIDVTSNTLTISEDCFGLHLKCSIMRS